MLVTEEPTCSCEGEVVIHLGNDPDQKPHHRTSKARGDLRDLLRKSVRRGPLEAWLGKIPYMQSACGVWEGEFEPRFNSMIPFDGVPRHISLLDD